ncbi:hypothetical protein SAMN05444159_1291 [Bradyrhizobium lablabi]|uniref:Uncharacterized protein n=1 Tax=Bradyrhizobium lablabi TaxID=722472 RepID=A0A1M6LJ54_9BRAD|nr:hypothetical protein [Bradyrhizobium lablabi]SHJ71215.1 hypothetical protein SAMN05444159_1291 [Bradyrhizobium lablabi]
MTDQFNDKHLLWWVLRAIDACRSDGTRRDTLLSETMWKNLRAPDWVLPAIREKYQQFDPGRPVPKHGSGP